MDDTYNPNGPDYQDAYNWHAANQNQALRDAQQAATPVPDPRQLAAQQLVQKYGQQAPSYANVQGHYFINDKPVNTVVNFPFTMDTGEQGAQMQFQQAKQQAAQAFLNRASGNVAAGTSGRALLQDPNFLRMSDADKSAVYGQTYQHSLTEDLQADQYGKLGMPTPTIADVRFRNTMPDRQKTEAEYMKTQEQILGAHPGVLAGDLQKDAQGNPVAGYDEATQTAYSPGQYVEKRDEFGQPTGTYEQKPPTKVFLPKFNRNRILQSQAIISGQQQYPQAKPAPRPGLDQIVNAPLNAVTSVFNNSLQKWGQAPLTAQDPARTARIQSAFRNSQAILSRNGINLPPDQMTEAMRLATSFAGGAEFDEPKLLQAARMVQDRGTARGQQLNTAHQVYDQRSQFTGADMTSGDFSGP